MTVNVKQGVEFAVIAPAGFVLLKAIQEKDAHIREVLSQAGNSLVRA